MLCRIAEIKNVGTFSQCNASNVPFEKITLIYGRNTYGKSTLGDIFYSLEKNQHDVVLARKSIPVPKGSDAQTIKFNFAAEGENEGQGLSLFRNNTWQQRLRDSHRLKTFNDSFYHDHVFTSRKFTRETKVNFSQFILGEQGVVLASRIKELNENKRRCTQRHKTLLKDVFSSVDDVDSFLVLALPDDIEETQRQRDGLNEEKYRLETQNNSLEELKARAELVHIDEDYADIVPNINEINEVYSTSLDTHHEQAKEQLQTHIKTHLATAHGSEHWLQQGIKYGKCDNCQFCGQVLSDDATSLIDNYKQYFDEAFDQHESFVKHELDRLSASFDSQAFIRIARQIDKNKQTWDTYPDIIGYKVAREQLITLSDSIDGLLTIIDEELLSTRAAFIDKYNIKIAKPHQKVDELDSAQLLGHISDVDEKLAEYVGMVERCNQAIDEFKEHLDAQYLEEQLSKITHETNRLETQLARVEKNVHCEELITLNASIEQFKADIPALETQLSTEQNAYLETYFGSINHYFTKLGSRNFLLERQLDTSGYEPVYHLKVKFHQQDIPEVDLDKLFSESDRRALGLSVFLASLDAMNEEDLQKAVIVFDDPVTSFDDHRVTATHREMVNLSERCEQIILLSHYREGLSQFIKTYTFGNNHRIKLIEITKNHETSSLKVGNFNEFLRTAHEENREKIINFVERSAQNWGCSLRLFLEMEISLRFGKQLRDQEIANDSLNNRINGMVEHNVVSGVIGRELHRWREDLNPDHHIWVGDDIENKRNTAQRFINFVYHDLIPA
jgi:wobble nucleotide-excising tRNase